MHDPKFEQEVQRKMHDLEFFPSESVWAGIQQGIAPRSRRRAVAILWWLFPGMFILAGGIIMYRHLVSTGTVAAVPVARKPAGGAGSGVGHGGVGVAGGTKGLAGEAGEAGGRGNAAGGMGSGIGTGGEGESQGVEGAEGQAPRMEVVTGRREDLASGAVETGGAAIRRIPFGGYAPALIGGMGSRRGVQAPRLPAMPANPVVSGIGQPRHPWRAGFVAGGGGASVYSPTGNELVAISAAKVYAGVNAYGPQAAMAAYSLAGANGAGYKRNMLEVNASYSYWAGIYVEQQIASRWSADIGLNLHYYSVQLESNVPAAAYAPTSASLIVPTSFTYAQTTGGAYLAGNQTYLNSYYFLELPAALQWKLNRSRTLPLYWRGGAVLSYLMSSNGLYFDANSGTYKSDNGVLRRMQASLHSGLMVGVPVKGLQVQVGPEVQYALTSMLSTGFGGGHLVYGGLRVAVMR